MNAIAKARYLRISPMKMRKVVKVIRGKKLDDALYILKMLPHKAARMVYKVLFSAKSNFKNRFPDAGDPALQIETIFVDQAPVLKRMMPRARGRADVLRKMSSHLTVIVGSVENKDDLNMDKKPAVKAEKPTAEKKAAPVLKENKESKESKVKKGSKTASVKKKTNKEKK